MPMMGRRVFPTQECRRIAGSSRPRYLVSSYFPRAIEAEAYSRSYNFFASGSAQLIFAILHECKKISRCQILIFSKNDLAALFLQIAPVALSERVPQETPLAGSGDSAEGPLRGAGSALRRQPVDAQ